VGGIRHEADTDIKRSVRMKWKKKGKYRRAQSGEVLFRILEDGGQCFLSWREPSGSWGGGESFSSRAEAELVAERVAIACLKIAIKNQEILNKRREAAERLSNIDPADKALMRLFDLYKTSDLKTRESMRQEIPDVVEAFDSIIAEEKGGV